MTLTNNQSNPKLSPESQQLLEETNLQLQKEKKSFWIVTVSLLLLLALIKIFAATDLKNTYLLVGASLLLISRYWKVLLVKSKIKKIYYQEKQEKQKEADHLFYLNYLKIHYEQEKPQMYEDLKAIYEQKYESKDHQYNRILLEEMFLICEKAIQTDHFGIVYYLQSFTKDLFYLYCDHTGQIHKTLHKQLHMIVYAYCVKAKDRFLMDLTLQELKKTHQWDEEVQKLKGKF